MLKILGSTESITQIGEGEVGISDDSKAGCNGKCKFGSEVDDSGVKDDEVRKKDQKLSKSQNLTKF